jgi:hypothetical protein
MMKKRHHVAHATLLASLAVVTAGCSLGSTPSSGSSTSNPTQTAAAAGASSKPAATKVDPCTLITQAEAATALGADPGPGTKDDGVHCAYHAGNDVSLNGVTVSSFPSNGPDFESVRNASKPSSGGAQLSDYQDVSGVGDSAFALISKTGNPGGSITVLKGSSMVEVLFSSSNSDPSKVLGQLAELGKTASGRL